MGVLGQFIVPLFAIGALLLIAGVFASRLPERFRRNRRRLAIGSFAAAFALLLVDISLNWEEAVEAWNAGLAVGMKASDPKRP